MNAFLCTTVGPKVSSATRAPRPGLRTGDGSGQYVDQWIWDYSPSVFASESNGPLDVRKSPGSGVGDSGADQRVTPTITGSLTSSTPNFSRTPSRTSRASASR